MASLTDRILADTTGRYAAPYAAAISDLFVAKVRRNYDAAEDALKQLQGVTRESMGIAELVGATSVLRSAAAFSSGQFRVGDPTMRFADQNIVPNVTFDEAIEDFIQRAPTTLRNSAERTALRIAELYSESNVAAFVRAAEQSVTERAQEFITQALEAGTGELDVARGLSMAIEEIREQSHGWTEWYSGMVFRTNANTATTAGRFKQAQDPDVAEVIPAMRFDAIRDGDARPNHLLMDGFIASTRSRVWAFLSPPLGYSCRCSVNLVSRFELEDLGRIRPDGTVIDSTPHPGAKTDEGFRHGGRPDIALG